MGWTSDLDVKLVETRWWLSCRDTRGEDTLAFVYNLRQYVVELSEIGLFGYDGVRFGTAR